MEFRDYDNIHAMLYETVEKRPSKTAFCWFNEDSTTESVTWKEFYRDVKGAAKSLIALGVEKGDKVNIISYTSYPWILTDMAVVSIGACTVGIYQTSLAADCQYIINHSESVIIFAEDTAQLEKLFSIKEKIPGVKQVILMKGEYNDDPWVISYSDFLDLGHSISQGDLEERLKNVSPDDIAMIVYTSGTTGVPKGAMLTHDNATFNAQSITRAAQPEDYMEQFLFLPLAHIYARGCVYFNILNGLTLTLARSMDTVIEDIKNARPHFFASVPRVFEKIYSKVISGAEAKGGLALKIFNWALKVGYQVSNKLLDDTPLSVLLRLKYGIASILVFKKLQEALGGRLEFCNSGAAPLEPSVAKFFHAAGILILEGIGMTENMTFSHVNRRDNFRFGWVGLPGPGIEQKIAPDGELLVRGRNVMKGYYKMPRETEETLSPDGWLHTGDMGEIDDEGFLRITGRKKDLIITSGGKNIAPSAIEGLMITSKYISQFCVIGDRRNFLAGLVTLDRENVEEAALQKGIKYNSFEDLFVNDSIKALIEEEVEAKNRYLASFETIKKILIVPEFTIENKLLTPTLKVKRNRAAELYQDQIDILYREAGKSSSGTAHKPLVERRMQPDRRILQADIVMIASMERRKEQRRSAVSW